MKPTVADLRIQLEGRVERVERAAAEWEDAAQVLEGRKWRTQWPAILEDDPELDEAIEAVFARGEAQFAPALNRIYWAKRRVERSAIRRLARLAVDTPPLGLRELLAELNKERGVVLSQQVGWSLVAAWLTVGAVFGPIFAAEWFHAPSLLIVAVVSALFANSRWQQAPRLQLTGSSVSLNGNGVRLDRIARIELRARSAGPKYQLVIFLKDLPEPFGVTCSAAPTDLLARLTAMGIECAEVDER